MKWCPPAQQASSGLLNHLSFLWQPWAPFLRTEGMFSPPLFSITVMHNCFLFKQLIARENNASTLEKILIKMTLKHYTFGNIYYHLKSNYKGSQIPRIQISKWVTSLLSYNQTCMGASEKMKVPKLVTTSPWKHISQYKIVTNGANVFYLALTWKKARHP